MTIRFVTILHTPVGKKKPEVLRRDVLLFADGRVAFTRYGKKSYSMWQLPEGNFSLFSTPTRGYGRDVHLSPASLDRILPKKEKPDDPTTRYRPRKEPFRSRWYRLHKKHLRALADGDAGLACTLADRKYAVFLACQVAR